MDLITSDDPHSVPRIQSLIQQAEKAYSLAEDNLHAASPPARQASDGRTPASPTSPGVVYEDDGPVFRTEEKFSPVALSEVTYWPKLNANPTAGDLWNDRMDSFLANPFGLSESQQIEEDSAVKQVLRLT